MGIEQGQMGSPEETAHEELAKRVEKMQQARQEERKKAAAEDPNSVFRSLYTALENIQTHSMNLEFGKEKERLQLIKKELEKELEIINVALGE